MYVIIYTETERLIYQFFDTFSMDIRSDMIGIVALKSIMKERYDFLSEKLDELIPVIYNDEYKKIEVVDHWHKTYIFNSISYERIITVDDESTSIYFMIKEES